MSRLGWYTSVGPPFLFFAGLFEKIPFVFFFFKKKKKLFDLFFFHFSKEKSFFFSFFLYFFQTSFIAGISKSLTVSSAVGAS